MQTIASFTVNHDVLEKGMYISRIDGDVVTYDIRMAKPNSGEYPGPAALHTYEHLFATYARNSAVKDGVVYVGPMGCRTGFYLLTRDWVGHQRAIELTRGAIDFVLGFSGEILGTKPRECGNCAEHDLAGAKKIAAEMKEVLALWRESELRYKE